MANWANTSYIIEGTKEDLDRIWEAITNPQRTPDADEGWEGDVLNSLGINWDRDNLTMRGFIEQSYRDKEGIHLEAEKAWERTDFCKVLQEEFPNISIFWITEEPGMEIYATNDSKGKYFSSRYCLDAFLDIDYYSEYFDTKEEAFQYINKITKGKVNSQENIDEYNKQNKDTDNFISLHKFTVI